MPSKLLEEVELLYAALATPDGIVVATEEPKAAIMRMYQARRETQDDRLRHLNFRRSPFDAGQFMILNLTPKAEAPQS